MLFRLLFRYNRRGGDIHEKNTNVDFDWNSFSDQCGPRLR